MITRLCTDCSACIWEDVRHLEKNRTTSFYCYATGKTSDGDFAELLKGCPLSGMANDSVVPETTDREPIDCEMIFPAYQAYCAIKGETKQRNELPSGIDAGCLAEYNFKHLTIINNGVHSRIIVDGEDISDGVTYIQFIHDTNRSKGNKEITLKILR